MGLALGCKNFAMDMRFGYCTETANNAAARQDFRFRPCRDVPHLKAIQDNSSPRYKILATCRKDCERDGQPHKRGRWLGIGGMDRKSVVSWSGWVTLPKKGCDLSARGRARPRSAALGYAPHRGTPRYAPSWFLRCTGRHENRMVGGF